MTVYCGRCRKIIFASKDPVWFTSVERPETGCQACGLGMEKLERLWRAVEIIRMRC